MTAAILAIVAGLIGALPQLLRLLESHLTRRNEVSHAVVIVEVDELDAGMRAVDNRVHPRA